jgi:hypothetical protein
MINYTFNSVFAPFMQSFLRLKKTMGFGTVKIEYIFKVSSSEIDKRP